LELAAFTRVRFKGIGYEGPMLLISGSEAIEGYARVGFRFGR